MLRLNGINAELFELINPISNRHSHSNREVTERLNYLEFRVQAIEEQVKQSELFPCRDDIHPRTTVQAVMARMLKMRMTVLKLLANFRCLRSSNAMMDNLASAQTLITLAKSLVEQYRDTVAAAGPEGISPLWGSLADRFLVGAISSMFLAAVYHPSVYGPQCRHSFHTALDLMTASPRHKAESKITSWCSLGDLRKISEDIQMAPLNTSPSDRTSTDEGFVDGVSCSTQPSDSDDISFMSLEPLPDHYLALLDRAFPGMGDQDTPESYGQMLCPSLVMYDKSLLLDHRDHAD